MVIPQFGEHYTQPPFLSEGGAGGECSTATFIGADSWQRRAVDKLLTSAGLTKDFALRRLSGGANNRVYVVDTSDDQFFLKHYFHHPDDARNRLDTEYRFSSFAFERRLPVPRPVSRDERRSLGLYSFIRGRPAKGGDISERRIIEAVDFVNQLNREPRPSSLPDASDACFILVEHLEGIDQRVNRLLAMEPRCEIDGEELRFVKQQLVPMWRQIAGSMKSRMSEVGPPRHRCLSPSDFGFHNVMIAPDSRAFFVDFEYAGWDDPIKLVCDFFTQISVPVPTAYLDLFLDHLDAVQANRSMLEATVRLLLPAYRLKWCCISLNEFLFTSSTRRRFAQRSTDQSRAKAHQLKIARRLLEAIDLGAARR